MPNSTRCTDSKVQSVYLAAVDVIEHKVELVLRLERVVEIDEEGMLEVGAKNVALRHDMLHLENRVFMPVCQHKFLHSFFMGHF